MKSSETPGSKSIQLLTELAALNFKSLERAKKYIENFEIENNDQFLQIENLADYFWDYDQKKMEQLIKRWENGKPDYSIKELGMLYRLYHLEKKIDEAILEQESEIIDHIKKAKEIVEKLDKNIKDNLKINLSIAVEKFSKHGDFYNKSHKLRNLYKYKHVGIYRSENNNVKVDDLYVSGLKSQNVTIGRYVRDNIYKIDFMKLIDTATFRRLEKQGLKKKELKKIIKEEYQNIEREYDADKFYNQPTNNDEEKSSRITATETNTYTLKQQFALITRSNKPKEKSDYRDERIHAEFYTDNRKSDEENKLFVYQDNLVRLYVENIDIIIFGDLYEQFHEHLNDKNITDNKILIKCNNSYYYIDRTKRAAKGITILDGNNNKIEKQFTYDNEEVLTEKLNKFINIDKTLRNQVDKLKKIDQDMGYVQNAINENAEQIKYLKKQLNPNEKINITELFAQEDQGPKWIEYDMVAEVIEYDPVSEVISEELDPTQKEEIDPSQKSNTMLCSEFVGHTLIANIEELNKRVINKLKTKKINLPEGEKLIKSPIPEDQNLEALTPRRLITMLKKDGIIKRVKRPFSFLKFMQANLLKEEIRKRVTTLERKSESSYRNINLRWKIGKTAHRKSYADLCRSDFKKLAHTDISDLEHHFFLKKISDNNDNIDSLKEQMRDHIALLKRMTLRLTDFKLVISKDNDLLGKEDINHKINEIQIDEEKNEQVIPSEFKIEISSSESNHIICKINNAEITLNLSDVMPYLTVDELKKNLSQYAPQIFYLLRQDRDYPKIKAPLSELNSVIDKKDKEIAKLEREINRIDFLQSISQFKKDNKPLDQFKVPFGVDKGQSYIKHQEIIEKNFKELQIKYKENPTKLYRILCQYQFTKEKRNQLFRQNRLPIPNDNAYTEIDLNTLGKSIAGLSSDIDHILELRKNENIEDYKYCAMIHSLFPDSINDETFVSLLEKQENDRNYIHSDQSVTNLTDKLYGLPNNKMLSPKSKRIIIAVNFQHLVNKHCTNSFDVMDGKKIHSFVSNLMNLYGFTCEEICSLAKTPKIDDEIAESLEHQAELIDRSWGIDLSNDTYKIEKIVTDLKNIRNYIQDHNNENKKSIKGEATADILNIINSLDLDNKNKKSDKERLKKLMQAVKTLKNLVNMRDKQNRGFLSRITRSPETIELYSKVLSLMEYSGKFANSSLFNSLKIITSMK